MKYTFDLTGRIVVDATNLDDAHSCLVEFLRGRTRDELLDIVRPNLVGTHTDDTNPPPAPSKNPADYLHIVAWGRSLHSGGYYIKLEQEKAAADGAPLDVIYERDGKWVRVTELFDKHREDINEAVATMRRR